MIRIFILITTLLFTPLCQAEFNEPSVKKVLISQVVEHPALNKTTQGIIAGLEAHGFVVDKNLHLRVESAQANSALAMQIANKFISQQPDVVVGVGTICAQSFIKTTQSRDLKMIFSSVTDPIQANLQKSIGQNMSNISGVSNFVAIEPQLQLFKKLQPNLQVLGIIYNPGEINSVSMVNKLESSCAAMNMKLIKQAVAKTADVAQAATRLSGQVDAIFISNDNTALSSLQSIIKAAQQKKIPVYVSDTDAVETGAVAALGPNQYAVGVQTAAMLAKVLQGADINALNVESVAQTDLVVNLNAARLANIQIPADILDTATTVIGEEV